MQTASHPVPAWLALGLALGASSCVNVDDPWLGAEVVTLDVAPPAIHGGTLIVTEHGSVPRAVVADPDRDRVVIVDLAARAVRAIELPPGLELGRLVEDDEGTVHVVARRAGRLLAIDPEGATLVAERETCEAPRGLAWEPRARLLHVACADGRLLSYGASGDEVRQIHAAADLRDVVVSGDDLLVSRFRSAETLRVRADGTVEPAHTLPSGTLTSPMSPELRQTYAPNTAVRLASSAVGTFVVHQRARVGVEAVLRGAARASTYSYSSRPVTNGDLTWADPCGNAVAHVAVTRLGADGTAMNVGAPISRGVTPADLAVSASGRLAVAFAGDPGGRFSAGPQVVVSDVTRAEGTSTCFDGEARGGYPGQVVSVAFAGERLVALTRSPAALVIEDEEPILLGGAAVDDTGHALFHLDLGGTIACATCHPGGGDDGHVWQFSATGAIRTLSLEGTVGRPPYHRAGDVPSFNHLMLALEPQMDAPPLGDGRTAALEAWLASVPLPPAGVARDAASVDAGAAIFERLDCASCHEGDLGSDRRAHAVATGTYLTAPLAGAAGRAPYLHDGSAPDLGSAVVAHGTPIEASELAALVAYLETR